MMSTLQAILLGMIQGLSEFLPISSSGHLVLVPWWLGIESPGLAVDAFLHWGTLTAVLVYFWRDWWDMVVALIRWLLRKSYAQEKLRLFWAIVVGTIPAAVIGYLFEDFFKSLFDSPAAAAYFLILTGLLLVLAERRHRSGLSLSRLKMSDAAAVGMAQALAIAPGLSRSGATIAAGLLRGLDRAAAARFSFLIGTPIIFGAGLLQVPDLLRAGLNGTGIPPVTLLAGFLAAAVTGFVCITFLLRYLRNHSLYVFAIYVWLIAGLTLVRFYLF